MNRRIPVLATIIVGAAVATMIALGFWQLRRAHERDTMKRAMIERMGLNPAPYPYASPADEAMLYRRLSASCDQLLGWQTRAGRAADGRAGWRHIATCRSNGHTAPFQADMGVSTAPDGVTAWRGGPVTGHAIRGPDSRRVLERLRGKPPEQRLMIIAETPASGFTASRQPDPSQEANTSWSYTAQWFLFAATALVIYTLALRKRWSAASGG